MLQRNPANAYYGKLLDTAEIVLGGPLSVRVGIDFWGEPNLSLHSENMPKIEGTMESRTVYANLCDDEQDSAILRQASWDAQAVRHSILQDFDVDRVPSMICPVLLVHCVWVDIDWLRKVFQCLDGLTIPLKAPKIAPLFRRMYRLGIQRSDRTTIDASWGNSMPGEFQVLSDVWESIWQQMTDLLQDSEPVKLEELWRFGSPPDYKCTHV